MGSERFLKAQVGLQADFGTSVTPTIQVPWVVDYEDQSEEHEVEMDAGTWTPTTQVAEMAKFAVVKAKGTGIFEMIPVLLNSGLADVNATGADPYTHTWTISPAAVGVPKPETFLGGAVGENLGGTGPAGKLADQYLKTLVLSGNINDKAVSFEAEYFGTGYDDNSGAGYAFASVALPATMDVMNALKGQINIQDAGVAGGDFATMTAFSCAILDWTWTLDTGLRPKWCLTNNVTTFAGVKYEPPSVEFDATVRTTSANYALVKVKKDARTYQELQLIVNGLLTRALTVNMTGRWVECPTPHARQDGEVVMKAKFRAQTPHTQTTTPHFAAITCVSKHNWGA